MPEVIDTPDACRLAVERRIQSLDLPYHPGRLASTTQRRADSLEDTSRTKPLTLTIDACPRASAINADAGNSREEGGVRLSMNSFSLVRQSEHSSGITWSVAVIWVRDGGAHPVDAGDSWCKAGGRLAMHTFPVLRFSRTPTGLVLSLGSFGSGT